MLRMNRIDGIPGTRIDIVRNVINLVPVHWIIDFLVSIFAAPRWLLVTIARDLLDKD